MPIRLLSGGYCQSDYYPADTVSGGFCLGFEKVHRTCEAEKLSEYPSGKCLHASRRGSKTAKTEHAF